MFVALTGTSPDVTRIKNSLKHSFGMSIKIGAHASRGLRWDACISFPPDEASCFTFEPFLQSSGVPHHFAIYALSMASSSQHFENRVWREGYWRMTVNGDSVCERVRLCIQGHHCVSRSLPSSCSAIHPSHWPCGKNFATAFVTTLLTDCVVWESTSPVKKTSTTMAFISSMEYCVNLVIHSKNSRSRCLDTSGIYNSKIVSLQSNSTTTSRTNETGQGRRGEGSMLNRRRHSSGSLNQQGIGKRFFVNGPGGTGKTFLYRVLCHAARGEAWIVLCVASSGIAALLLIGGRTAHYMFKIPVEGLDEASICKIPKESNRASLLRAARLIIWDEMTMQHRNAPEALDRTLRDIRNDNRPFGGLTVVFGGDFQQILPVVPKGSREDIVNRDGQRRRFCWDSADASSSIQGRFETVKQARIVVHSDHRSLGWRFKLDSGSCMAGARDIQSRYTSLPHMPQPVRRYVRAKQLIKLYLHHRRQHQARLQRRRNLLRVLSGHTRHQHQPNKDHLSSLSDMSSDELAWSSEVPGDSEETDTL